jgi:hypothetical protein
MEIKAWHYGICSEYDYVHSLVPNGCPSSPPKKRSTCSCIDVRIEQELCGFTMFYPIGSLMVLEFDVVLLCFFEPTWNPPHPHVPGMNGLICCRNVHLETD